MLSQGRERFQNLSGFAKYAWLVIGYNLFVIVWGAFVRATGSGAGCGDHWPTCNGEVIPRAPAVETMIEFFHRATSGIALLMVAGLVVWAFRRYPKRHAIRRAMVYGLVFTIISALIGAILVLYQLVADDESTARLVSMTLHLINTFMLLGALTLGAWWASGGPIPNWSQTDRRKRLILGVALVGTLIVGASGAIIALGDTLFPAATLSEGLQQKFDPNAHIAVRLRMLHPALAISVAAYLAVMSIHFTRPGQGEQTRFWAKILLGLFVLQLALGGINVLLLAPVWMQLLHLLVSDIIWISLVILSNTVLTEEAAVVEALPLSQPVGADG